MFTRTNQKEVTLSRQAFAQVFEFTCKQCGKPFQMLNGYRNRYWKMYGRDPLYCSRQCTGVARRTKTEATHTFICEGCGKELPRKKYVRGSGYVKYYTQQRVCSAECRHTLIKRTAKERFESGEVGRHVKKNGYIWLSLPALISPTGVKMEIMEHRWVMEQKIGRRLFSEETVHHVNGDRSDNRIENLELFSSRHGPGQRVIDKIDFAIEMLRLYPEFARQRGVALADIAPEAH